MLLKLLRLVVVVLAVTFVSSAKADPVNTVYVDGSYAFVDTNGVKIPPYGGTLNHQTEAFYCVDFSHTIKAGDTWNVTITSLTASSFGLTRLGNQLYGGVSVYAVMAYVITEMMGTTDHGQKAAYQYAIWSLSGGTTNNSTIGILNAAVSGMKNSGFTGQGWEILTPTGSTGQEFVVYVPEPGTLLLLVIGLVLTGITMRKRSAAGAQAH